MFDYFRISKGTRQGDPLPPLIFALCIKPFTEIIRLEQKIIDISSIGKKNNKLSMYEDDIKNYLLKP